MMIAEAEKQNEVLLLNIMSSRLSLTKGSHMVMLRLKKWEDIPFDKKRSKVI